MYRKQNKYVTYRIISQTSNAIFRIFVKHVKINSGRNMNKLHFFVFIDNG